MVIRGLSFLLETPGWLSVLQMGIKALFPCGVIKDDFNMAAEIILGEAREVK